MACKFSKEHVLHGTVHEIKKFQCNQRRTKTQTVRECRWANQENIILVSQLWLSGSVKKKQNLSQSEKIYILMGCCVYITVKKSGNVRKEHKKGQKQPIKFPV